MAFDDPIIRQNSQTFNTKKKIGGRSCVLLTCTLIIGAGFALAFHKAAG
jgi:hypothetical protein